MTAPTSPEIPFKLSEASGLVVRPGLVDFHGDGFERHLAPRRGAVKDLAEGLRAVDAELAVNGITTACLAQFWSWEGGMRGPDFARRLAHALKQGADGVFTRMQMQLRIETHMIDDFPAILELVEEAGIRTVVFNDHLPHAALAKGKKPPRLEGQALKAGRSPDAHRKLLEELHERGPDVPGALETLSENLTALGVTLGSHDDQTSQGRSEFRAMGARLAEFPETAEALEAASEAGDTIILGAPNVARGGSHKRGLSAGDAVRAGRCDILVSDYHYPALRQAALALEDEGIDAWPKVSSTPARILRLETGDDYCVLDRTGRVVGTMADGRWSYMTQPLFDALKD